MDYNVYVENPNRSISPLIIWGPAINDTCQLAFNSLKAFQEVYPEFSSKSKSIDNAKSVFKSEYLGNYQITQAFKGSSEALRLPENITKLLKIPKNYKPYFGAYPYYF
jgi:hypothetical protein